jgi:hypothetical protein
MFVHCDCAVMKKQSVEPSCVVCLLFVTRAGRSRVHPGNGRTVDRNRLSDRGLFTSQTESTEEIKIKKVIIKMQALRNTMMECIQYGKHFLHCFALKSVLIADVASSGAESPC